MHWIEQLPSVFKEIGFSGVCDIAIVTLVIYTLLAALKRTRRSGLIITGILIVSAIYLAARKFNLVLTEALLNGFFAVILVALVVIFQEDLRYFFERVGLWWVERRLPLHKRTTARLPPREVEVLARTVGDLARARIGALIVIRGRDAIARHLDGGEDVRGLVSEPLLKSIFDPHSLGHDGAVIIDGHLIDRLGCHLPLSKNLERLPRSGTRHAAALGLSERSDALCLVVSEERGTISVARRGNIRLVLTPADLVEALEAFYDEIAPRPEATSWKNIFRRNYREKMISVVLSVALWVVVVQGAKPTTHTCAVPVDYGLLPSDLEVRRVDPEKINVTFSGERKAFEFMGAGDIKLVLDLSNASLGNHPFPITARDLSFPKELALENLEPRAVYLDVELKSSESGTNHPPARRQ